MLGIAVELAGNAIGLLGDSIDLFAENVHLLHSKIIEAPTGVILMEANLCAGKRNEIIIQALRIVVCFGTSDL
ncbi:hypothetical protein VMCG_05853 [Cytospora schulzeri]|uniref:Uncharacterized protein n=1 Tax=Cytospora schulzeri TaxID=448051 RepID=A0A423WD33_9PEZI|nr:hypothetical protein VMCG_05853 [Valsa malicola]